MRISGGGGGSEGGQGEGADLGSCLGHTDTKVLESVGATSERNERAVCNQPSIIDFRRLLISSSSTSMPTSSKERSLILLRTPTQPPTACPYSLAFSSSSSFPPSSIHHLPVLYTTFDNLDRLVDILSTNANGYDGVIMTSARSADAWAAAAASLSLDPPSSDASTPVPSLPPFFVVGQATRSALYDRTPAGRHRPEKNGILGAEETGTGEALGRYILRYFAEGGNTTEEEGGMERSRTRRLLYLTGDKNRDILPSILSPSSSSPPPSSFSSSNSSLTSSPPPHIAVDPLQVYRTSPLPDFSASFTSLVSSLSSPTPCSTPPSPPPPQSTSLAPSRLSSTPPPSPSPPPPRPHKLYLALFSPSSAAPVLPLLSLLPSSVKVRLVAIGPTTRDYLRREGWEACEMAERPDARGVREAVERAVAREGEAEAEEEEREGTEGGEGAVKGEGKV